MDKERTIMPVEFMNCEACGLNRQHIRIMPGIGACLHCNLVTVQQETRELSRKVVSWSELVKENGFTPTRLSPRPILFIFPIRYPLEQMPPKGLLACQTCCSKDLTVSLSAYAVKCNCCGLELSIGVTYYLVVRGTR